MNIDLNLTDVASGNTALCLAAVLGHNEVAGALILMSANACSPE